MKENLPVDIECLIITRALEIDLRNLVASEILHKKKLISILDKKYFEFLKNKAIQDKKRNNEVIFEDDVPDGDLLKFIDFGNAIKTLIKNKSLLSAESNSIIENIKEDIETIKIIRDAAAHGRSIYALQKDELDKFVEKIKKFESFFLETKSVNENLLKGETTYDQKDYYSDERELDHNLPQSDANVTGFIQRKQLNQTINKVIKNTRVISFVGQAGVGKTALALDKCYELHAKGNEFDVFIWHSFKTESFSEGELIDLKNLINTSDKFFSNFEVKNLDEDPIKNFIKYLEQNKVLLVLDNLETVLDQNITNFLNQFAEADTESKIFITSRLPVDSGHPIRVGPFNDKEALDYFRRFARFLQLDELNQQTKDEKVRKLVNSRNNNPLLIKYSLVAVSKKNKGLDDAFKESKDELNYCYMNVYETLNDESKEILKILYFLDRDLGISEILNAVEMILPEIVQLSLRDLQRIDFVRPNYVSGIEKYKIRREVKPFIKENKFFTEDDKNEIFLKYTQHVASAERVESNIDKIDQIPVSFSSFLIRPGDGPAYEELHNISIGLRQKERDKLTPSWKKGKYKKKRFKSDAEIEATIKALKTSHKDYCEVYRIEGLYYAQKKNLEKTRECYERAIKLQPNYKNLYFYYTQRLGELQDTKTYMEMAEKTYKLFPDHPTAIQNLFLAKRRAYSFDDKKLEELYIKMKNYLKSSDIPRLHKKKIAMQILTYNINLSHSLVDRKYDFDSGFKALKNAFKDFDDFEARGWVDYLTVEKSIQKVLYSSTPIANHFRGTEKEFECISFVEKARKAKKKYIDPIRRYTKENRKRLSLNDESTGTYYWENQKFTHIHQPGGYITMDDNSYIEEHDVIKRQIFVHKDELSQIQDIKDGDMVKFSVTQFLLPKTKTKKEKAFFVANKVKKIKWVAVENK